MTEPSKDARSPVLLLAGGGIDSTLCMHHFCEAKLQFRALHFDYGQQASRLEWEAVKATSKHFGGIATQVKIASPQTFFPGEVIGRNAAFIFLALMHLAPPERLICIGIHAGTPFYDCSKSFFESTERLVAEHSDSRVRLIAPLVDYTKPEIVALLRETGLDLRLTYSCQQGVEGGCGTCHSCLDRRSLGC
ncbi:7-cyano-7-deazaguanine synthase [Burkholderia gladioli]|uniref:7-cyano-7-deazaguanine synthase n=1 Tax=Burkholderia gladioli TaxID=28095 RepID=UPI0013DEF30F|nr:7-cyano-7-deazaguanine synthase [Burkholderia gladioli]